MRAPVSHAEYTASRLRTGDLGLAGVEARAVQRGHSCEHYVGRGYTQLSMMFRVSNVWFYGLLLWPGTRVRAYAVIVYRKYGRCCRFTVNAVAPLSVHVGTELRQNKKYTVYCGCSLMNQSEVCVPWQHIGIVRTVGDHHRVVLNPAPKL